MSKKQCKPNRLRDYDYSSAGFYFVTICTSKKIHYFGKIMNGRMIYSKIGKIAKACLEEIPQHFREVKLDASIVMPNHIHANIVIKADVGDRHADVDIVGDRHVCPLQGRPYQKLSVVVFAYKSAVTIKTNRQQSGSKFKWQRSFYDHIIRNEKSLGRIRHYIVYNAAKWEYDRENNNKLPLNEKRRFWRDFLR